MKRRTPDQFEWWHEVSLMVVLMSLGCIALLTIPRFLEIDRQLLLSRHIWELAILALGMTLIIITGGIDLSVGSAMGMCAVAFGICHQSTGSLPLSCLVCVLVGVMGGAVNGWLISKVRIHPLIVTLATYAAF